MSAVKDSYRAPDSRKAYGLFGDVFADQEICVPSGELSPGNRTGGRVTVRHAGGGQERAEMRRLRLCPEAALSPRKVTEGTRNYAKMPRNGWLSGLFYAITTRNSTRDYAKITLTVVKITRKSPLGLRRRSRACRVETSRSAPATCQRADLEVRGPSRGDCETGGFGMQKLRNRPVAHEGYCETYAHGREKLRNWQRTPLR